MAYLPESSFAKLQLLASALPGLRWPDALAADRVFGELSQLVQSRGGLVVVMDAVPLLDAGGLAAMEKLIHQCDQQQTQLIFADLQFQPLKTLSRAGLQPVEGRLVFAPTLEAAVALVSAPQFPETAS